MSTSVLSSTIAKKKQYRINECTLPLIYGDFVSKISTMKETICTESMYGIIREDDICYYFWLTDKRLELA